jgi:hypothetical protein
LLDDLDGGDRRAVLAWDAGERRLVAGMGRKRPRPRQSFRRDGSFPYTGDTSTVGVA